MNICKIILIVILFSLCDIPVICPASESVSKDYSVYNDYRHSLIALQQDTAQMYLELPQKNPQAVYEHVLQVIEKTAVLIGHAEIVSHDVNGFQGSLKGQMELLLEFGLSEKQKKELLDLGYTEKDIVKIMKSLAYYNDHYYHATGGFSPEQREQFLSMGLTDAQIKQLQVSVTDHYTQIHTLEEEIKHHQRELLYVQFSLSIAALKTLLDQGYEGKKSDNLKRGEEKLLKAIKNVSEDHSSLERVKAFSKQVFKAAEQNIRSGENKCMVDFFVGLQIYCSAVTALHGDVTFGLVEIKSYETVLSQCISPETLVLPVCNNESFNSSEPDFAEPAYTGDIEESNEDNNTGWIVAVVKASDATEWQIIQVLAEWGLPPEVQELFKEFLKRCIGIGAEAATFITHAGGVIFTLIMTAPPAGGSWVDCITGDPSGNFKEICEDKDTVAAIEEGTFNEGLDECEQAGYNAVYTDPMQIVYTIMHAQRVYKGNNHYFYYMVNNAGAWVVEVEPWEHPEYGRVVTAYKVMCEPYTCGNNTNLTILEKWILCDNFTLVWAR